jgi:hypothetical protein
MITLDGIIQKINLKNAVSDFLKNNPNPPDEKVHEWADKNGYNKHDVEAMIYSLATSYVKFLNSGRAAEKGVSAKDVNPKELAMGMKVESEHSDDLAIKKKVSLDHIAEFEPKVYYPPLMKMENVIKTASAIHRIMMTKTAISESIALGAAKKYFKKDSPGLAIINAYAPHANKSKITNRTFVKKMLQSARNESKLSKIVPA